MPQKLSKLFFLSWVVIGVPYSLLAVTSPGNPTGYVNDYVHVLTQEQKQTLEQKLVTFNASTTNEVAVVLVQNLQGDYIEHYASELFSAWHIGKAKQDNGILLLVSLDERAVRIEVGYGLEGVLTDAMASKIIRTDIQPAFKVADFYGGIDKALDDIISATQGEYSSQDIPEESEKDIEWWVMVVIFLIFQGLSFIASVLARSKSWWAGGVLGGVLGGVVTFFHVLGLTTFVGLVITFILMLLGLLFDYVVSNTYQNSIARGSAVPWWVGGGSSSGGFGGFGGGSSGGGGASGSW
jgi:uncharacterized protein